MSECYLMTVCASSSLDESSKNFSLFNLIEEVRVVSPTLRDQAWQRTTFELHTYFRFDAGEVASEFDVRVRYLRDDTVVATGEALRFLADNHRIRLRVQGGLPVPVARITDLQVETRRAGGRSWTVHAPRWPFSSQVFASQAEAEKDQKESIAKSERVRAQARAAIIAEPTKGPARKKRKGSRAKKA